MNREPLRLILLAICMLAVAPALYATTLQRWLILDDKGGDGGHITVTQKGSLYSIDWQTQNNGRGARNSERLELNAAGFPKIWRLVTHSDLGDEGSHAGPLESTYSSDGRQAQWRINGQSTHRPVEPGQIFAMPGASPWALGLYARALLAQPNHSLNALPSGRLWLEELGKEVFDGTSVNTYLVHGPGDQVETVRLDASGGLVAIGDGKVVREGDTGIATELRRLQHQKEYEAHQRLQKKLLHTFSGPVRVRNVHVFDPQIGGLGPLCSVVFFRDRITGIQPLESPGVVGETLIDGEGGTLVPGLHDTHYHATLAGPEGAWLTLAAGITTTRDMGSDNDSLQQYLLDVAAGRLPGPRILPSGLIEGESPFALRSTGFVVDNEAAAVQDVNWYGERGYFQIKIYNSVHPEWVPAIARAAHAWGMRVAGHIPAFTNPDAMMDAGYDEITHANQLMLGWVLKPGEDTRTPLRLTAMSRFAQLDLDSPPVRATLEHLAAKNIAVEPTLAIMRRLLLNRTGQVEPEDQWWFSHITSHLALGRMITVLPGFTIMPVHNAADDAAYRGAAAKMIELVQRLRQQGTFLVAGSDDNDGFVLQRELELFVAGGFTPAEALTRATLDTAKYLGHGQEWGSIARGKSADFFLIPGDPTRDITAIHSVRMTVAQGRVYFPSEIYEALGITPFVAPARISEVSAPTR